MVIKLYLSLGYYCKPIGVNSMKTLTLTDTQFEVLYDIIADTVDAIEDDLITTEDENGKEILEDISEYEAHKIYQQMITLSGGF